MKLLKKLMVVFVAALMVMSLTSRVYAEGETGSSTGTSTETGGGTTGDSGSTPNYNTAVTVKGITKGDTLKLYRIASASVNSTTNVIEYTWEGGLTAADFDFEDENYTFKQNSDGQLAALEALTKVGTGSPAYSQAANDSGDAGIENVAPGYYVAIVEGNKDSGKIYQRMLINTVPKVVDNAYAAHDSVVINPVKSTPIDITKTEDKSATDTTQVKTTDGYSLGDNINFKIVTNIPSYPKTSVNATFVITDTPTGLVDDETTVKVTVTGDSETGETAGSVDGKFTVAKSGNGFTVTFVKAYILAHPNAGVTVTYVARLVGPVQLDGTTTNTAKITYNPNPNSDTTVEPDDTDEQKTYGLVFEKTNEKGEPLENAVFALYDGETPVTDKDGNPLTFTTKKQTIDGEEHTYVWFEGLKAGTYTIKETSAPAGYVTVADFTMVVSKEVSTADNPATTDKAETNYTVRAEAVQNEKGVELPETGGIGTTIFHIAGAALVLGAGILLISKKRMNNN